MKRSAYLAAAVGALLAFGVIALISRPVQQPAVTGLHGLEAVFYKSPTCGCCEGYADALKAAGVRLKVVNDAEATNEAKVKHGIPTHAYSCHTFVIDGYVVEGHVPLEALERFLAERPDADGIVLPGMPTGTPGMPGPKVAPYQILLLDDGQLSPYLTL